jgi:uncharacterized protein YoaH (UPF0181 family)
MAKSRQRQASKRPRSRPAREFPPSPLPSQPCPIHSLDIEETRRAFAERWRERDEVKKRWQRIGVLPPEGWLFPAVPAKSKRGRKKGSGMIDDTEPLKRIKELMARGTERSRAMASVASELKVPEMQQQAAFKRWGRKLK